MQTPFARLANKQRVLLLIGLLLSAAMNKPAVMAQDAKPDAEVEADRSWDEFSEGEILFALQVAPVLEAKCSACHGKDADNLESGFSILSREDVLAGGDSGESILVPGEPDKSWLYKSSTWEHDYLQMPPKENDRLDKEALAALRSWIELEAPWPDEQRQAVIRERMSAGQTIATSGGLSEQWDQRRYDSDRLWAYQPLRQVQLPPSSGLAANNAIDRFINAGLNDAGLSPAPRADRPSLVRRLFFDVKGLPPTPEQVATFVHDPDPDQVAWEQLVERVLASPSMGEQAARYWLDKVRYADSAGFANDYQRPNAWRYRDYVVHSLNQDRSLDQFIVVQLAGDEVDPANPECLIATGMLRMGPWEQTGMSVDRVTRQQFLDDVTDIVGQSLLAHPLQCARCHDHKFDPIPTRDYYRIQAVFATTQFAEREAEFLPYENQRLFEQQRQYLQARVDYFQAVLDELNQKETRNAKAWYAERGWKYGTRAQKLKQGVPEDEIAPKKLGFEAKDFGMERIARKYLERHRWELDRYRPLAFGVYSGATPARRGANSRIAMPEDPLKDGKLESTSVLTGGDVFSPSVPVTPGVLSVLTGAIEAQTAPTSTGIREQSSIRDQSSGRRLEFARWITDPERNPLTPRVLVNRLWQQHFGTGLVGTANNFGTAAEPPTHPLLLEYLAGEFVRAGWSAKHMHRLILTSEAYCRSTQFETQEQERLAKERDPNATKYAVFKSRRLVAEELRDAYLAVSGLLNHEIGGPPVRPNINPEVAVQPRQIMGTYAPIYQPSPEPGDRNRRTLYAIRLRGLRDPMLEVFNQPSPDLSCELRDSSTVAPQALTLMNSQFSYERALALAERLIRPTFKNDKQVTDDADRRDSEVINRAFQLLFGRQPNPQEMASCLRHWGSMTRRHDDVEMHDYLPPHELTRSFVDENTGEQFSFTEPLEQNRDYRPSVWLSRADARTRGLADVCLVLLSSNEFLFTP